MIHDLCLYHTVEGEGQGQDREKEEEEERGKRRRRRRNSTRIWSKKGSKEEREKEEANMIRCDTI